MVRSEEQLRVGTEQVTARRMRVVKYVVTEEVQISVPIRREEIRIEEVPLDALDTDGGVVTEGEPLDGRDGGPAHRGGRSPTACPTRSCCTPSVPSSPSRSCRSSACG